ncbi:alpha-protein kinase 2-like [Polyodon spathula]|uniref:alpha-protein kinase 2-like n=1 Tax=Polyodon spathula TaxID=7913 RepID=UPI001B7F0C64|nr:alpha-protein kinase 2-like [Polyodon spathula]
MQSGKQECKELLLLKEGDHSDDDLSLEKDHIVNSPEKVKKLLESSDSKAMDAISGGQSGVKKPAVYRSPSENNPSSKHREMVHTASQYQGICEGELSVKVKGGHLSETDKEELKGKIKDIAQSREENSTGIFNSEKMSTLKQSGTLDCEKLCKWDLSNVVPKCENVIPMETKAILSDSSTVRENCTEESLFPEKTDRIYLCERTSRKKRFGLLCEELNIQMTETRHYPESEETCTGSYLECKDSGRFSSSLEKAEAAENFSEPLDSLCLKNSCLSEDLNVEMDQHSSDEKTLSQTQYSSTTTSTLDKPLQLKRSPSFDSCEFAKCSMKNQKVNLCNNTPRKDNDLKDILPTLFIGAEGSQEGNTQYKARDNFQHTKESDFLRNGASQQRDEITKRMRLSGERTKGAPVEAKQRKQHLGENEHVGLKKKEGQRATGPETPKKNHNEPHKKKHPIKEENKVPKVLRHIHAETFPDISGNIKLWCQFGDIYTDSTITWSKDGVVLAKVQRSAGDDSPDSLAIVQATVKDQGMYQCTLKNPNGKMSSEFRLTSEALNELISKQELEGGEEIKCAQLMFREDFLRDQYFGDDLLASIVTEEQHFGEGLHRKAFRTKVINGLMPVFNSGHACVLKVHNAIAYGTKNSDELIQKNYSLAVQECHVQNTAREYIKEYRADIKCTKAFGEVPEIIPVYLIHRPANNIPYATLEEELVGDFVKYSVKDGKEMNMTRRDSDAGQKCCTFQHWVYKKTDGNLLVTDMQGVGMKLTDVGIATCGKGYKGFRGNCATSFIDQFNSLHHCNKFCEMLGLKSLQSSQPKPRKTAAVKVRGQPSSKKIVFLPHTKSKT